MSNSFSHEFKDQIVKEVNEVGSVQIVAKKHSLVPRTIQNWMHGHKNKDKIIEKKRVRDLVRENHDLKLQNELLKDLLKKTVQVFGSDEKPF